MEGRYSLVTRHSGLWRNLKDGDFEEEEVWEVIEDGTGSPQPQELQTNEYSAFPVSRPLPISTNLIPRSNNNISGHSSLEDKVVQQSAPFSGPQWPKVYQNGSKKKIRKVTGEGSDVDYVDDSDHYQLANCTGDSDEEEEEDDDADFNYKLPPHEFISRRLARSQISSSVFEGVGRTLKGRDLSKVRNAVLTRTGFLESI